MSTAVRTDLRPARGGDSLHALALRDGSYGALGTGDKRCPRPHGGGEKGHRTRTDRVIRRSGRVPGESSASSHRRASISRTSPCPTDPSALKGERLQDPRTVDSPGPVATLSGRAQYARGLIGRRPRTCSVDRWRQRTGAMSFVGELRLEGVLGSSYPLCAVSKHISYRRASRYSGCLKRNSCPTNTKACSIGVPERRSSQYSFKNSAESGVPASICIACMSLEGAATLSEVRLLGLYQYISVLLSKGRCL